MAGGLQGIFRAALRANCYARRMHAPQTEITVTRDGAELARHVFGPGEYVIGREAGCAIFIDDAELSRQHARLTLNYDHALIEDLRSSNGTFVNGVAVAECTRLWPGQKITLGEATLELRRVPSASSNPLRKRYEIFAAQVGGADRARVAASRRLRYRASCRRCLFVVGPARP